SLPLPSSTASNRRAFRQRDSKDHSSLIPFSPTCALRMDFVMKFSLYNFCRPHSARRRSCCSAIGGDECDSAIFLSTSSPMASRRTDEIVVKWIANNTWNLAAVFPWLECKTIDRIQRVARQVGKTSILINPEVIKPSAADVLNFTNWIEGNRVNFHPHEELFCRSGVIEIAAFWRILNAVDAR